MGKQLEPRGSRRKSPSCRMLQKEFILKAKFVKPVTKGLTHTSHEINIARTMWQHFLFYVIYTLHMCEG